MAPYQRDPGSILAVFQLSRRLNGVPPGTLFGPLIVRLPIRAFGHDRRRQGHGIDLPSRGGEAVDQDPVDTGSRIVDATVWLGSVRHATADEFAELQHTIPLSLKTFML